MAPNVLPPLEAGRMCGCGIVDWDQGEKTTYYQLKLPSIVHRKKTLGS